MNGLSLGASSVARDGSGVGSSVGSLVSPGEGAINNVGSLEGTGVGNAVWVQNKVIATVRFHLVRDCVETDDDVTYLDTILQRGFESQ